MAYNEEIYEQAKEYFLTPNIKGKHKYTAKDIEKKLANDYPDEDTPSSTTILRWSKARDKDNPDSMSWRELWQEPIKKALGNISEEVVANMSKEEAIVEQLEQFQNYLGGLAVDLVTKGRRFFRDKKDPVTGEKIPYIPKTSYEAVAMIQTGMGIFNNQKGEILTPKDLSYNINIIEIGDDEAQRDVTDEVRVITDEDKAEID